MTDTLNRNMSTSDENRAEGISAIQGKFVTITSPDGKVHVSVRSPAMEMGVLSDALVLCGQYLLGNMEWRLTPNRIPTCLKCVAKLNHETRQLGHRDLWNAGHALDTWAWLNDRGIAEYSGIPDELEIYHGD